MKDFPTIYVNVGRYRDWIGKHTETIYETHRRPFEEAKGATMRSTMPLLWICLWAIYENKL